MLIDLAILLIAGWLNRRQQDVIEYLREENRYLRRLHPGKLHFTRRDRQRLSERARRIGRKFADVGCLVHPDTLMRWYRALITQKYDGSIAKRGRGRRRTSAEIRALIVQMASDNPSWGYTRIRGSLHRLGLEVGRTTIQRILKEEGASIQRPAPRPGARSSAATWVQSPRWTFSPLRSSR